MAKNKRVEKHNLVKWLLCKTVCLVWKAKVEKKRKAETLHWDGYFWRKKPIHKMILIHAVKEIAQNSSLKLTASTKY